MRNNCHMVVTQSLGVIFINATAKNIELILML